MWGYGKTLGCGIRWVVVFARACALFVWVGGGCPRAYDIMHNGQQVGNPDNAITSRQRMGRGRIPEGLSCYIAFVLKWNWITAILNFLTYGKRTSVGHGYNAP